MIEFYDVSKVYPNGVAALRNVTVRISKGEFVFIVGPSGAGKSTFTKLIYREEAPTSGQIVVDGLNSTKMRNRDVSPLRRKIGVVFQDFKLLNDRTVFDNVGFVLEVTGYQTREVLKRVPMALEMVGLRDRAKAHPLELSGGEQQRIALARAIVRNPSLVVADEPTGNLDPDNSWAIIKLLAEINRMGATVVVATHEKTIVNAMQKRVVAIDGGRVVRDEERGVYGYDA